MYNLINISIYKIKTGTNLEKLVDDKLPQLKPYQKKSAIKSIIKNNLNYIEDGKVVNVNSDNKKTKIIGFYPKY